MPVTDTTLSLSLCLARTAQRRINHNCTTHRISCTIRALHVRTRWRHIDANDVINYILLWSLPKWSKPTAHSTQHQNTEVMHILNYPPVHMWNKRMRIDSGQMGGCAAAIVSNTAPSTNTINRHNHQISTCTSLLCHKSNKLRKIYDYVCIFNITARFYTTNKFIIMKLFFFLLLPCVFW